MPQLIHRCIVFTALAGGLFFHSQAEAASTPIFKQSRSFTHQFLELKDFNNSGDALVNVADGGDPSVPAILRGASELRLGNDGNGLINRLQAEGLTDAREDGTVLVTGYVGMSDGYDRAALWTVNTNGAYTLKVVPNVVLPPDSSAPGEQRLGIGFAVNKTGTIVGSGSSHITGFALRWSPPQHTAVRYLQSGGFVDINESGLMLANNVEFDRGGSLSHYTGALIAFDGMNTEVPLLQKEPGAIAANHVKQLSGEWVVGTATIQGRTRAMAWRISSPSSQNLPNPAYALDAENFDGQSINASGVVVGRVNGGLHSGDPILWSHDNGVFTGHRFGDLLPEEAFFNANTVQIFINDAGQVALQSQNFQSAIVRIFEPIADGLAQFVSETSSIEEGKGPITFSVKLTRALDNNGAVTVNYQTLEGTALAGENFSAVNSALTWAPGESGLKTITVPVADNLQFDEGKTFQLRLSGATGAQLSSASVATGYIFDPVQQVQTRNEITTELFAVAVAVLKGQSQVIVQLQRTNGTDGWLVVTNFQTSDITARVGVDYQVPANLSVEWAAGEGGVKSIAFPLLNPAASSGAKDFMLRAEAILEGASFSSQVYTSVSILSGPDKSQPKIKTDLISLLAGRLSLSAIGVQGTTLELQKASTLDGAYLKIAEATFANGEVSFSPEVSATAGAGFYRLQLKE